MISLCFSLHLLFCFLFTVISFLTFLLRFHLNYYYIMHNWKIPCISLFWLLELARLWWMTLLRCVKNSIWILFGRRRRTFGPSIVTIRIGGEQRLWAKSTVVLLTHGERSHAAKACKCWKKMTRILPVRLLTWWAACGLRHCKLFHCWKTAGSLQ